MEFHRSTLLCLLWFLSATASAQSDPSIIGWGDWTGELRIHFDQGVPTNAPIIATVPSDGCFHGGPWIEPDMTEIAVAGQSVTMDFYSHLPVCFSAGDPLTVWRYEQSLGLLPVGSYTVTARYYYIEHPDSAPFAVLTAPLVVGGAASSTALPSTSLWSTGLMTLLLGAMGWHRARLRRLRS